MFSNQNSGVEPQDFQTIIHDINHLINSRAYRARHRIVYIEGVRNFIQAVENGFECKHIFYSKRLLIVPYARKLVRSLSRLGVPCSQVSPEQFRQFSVTHRASGIGAIVRQKWCRLQDACPDAGLFWTVLSKVRSEGNFGTLIRTSEAVGGAGFILLDKTVDPYSATTLRASMGALFRQSFVRTTQVELQDWMRKHGLRLICATPNGDVDFQQCAFPPQPLLFLGEERKGLDEGQLNCCNLKVRIPMSGKADSLNLGVAGSLLMYEIYRMARRV